MITETMGISIARVIAEPLNYAPRRNETNRHNLLLAIMVGWLALAPVTLLANLLVSYGLGLGSGSVSDQVLISACELGRGPVGFRHRMAFLVSAASGVLCLVVAISRPTERTRWPAISVVMLGAAITWIGATLLARNSSSRQLALVESVQQWLAVGSWMLHLLLLPVAISTLWWKRREAPRIIAWLVALSALLTVIRTVFWGGILQRWPFKPEDASWEKIWLDSWTLVFIPIVLLNMLFAGLRWWRALALIFLIGFGAHGLWYGIYYVNSGVPIHTKVWAALNMPELLRLGCTVGICWLLSLSAKDAGSMEQGAVPRQ